MDTVIAAPASCEVRAVIRFLHAEGQSAAAFIFTNQSEVDFGIILIYLYNLVVCNLIPFQKCILRYLRCVNSV